MPFQVTITKQAESMVRDIPDRRMQRQLISRMHQLANEPDKQGNALRGPLAGYRSCRAVGQRYRIIYSINDGRAVVYVVAAGIRKEGDKRDIYTLTQRLLRLGLLD